MNYFEEIDSFKPHGVQEEGDLKVIKEILQNMDVRRRDNPLIHLTSSAFVLNPPRTKTLMVYHNIYNSWSWTGGHGDGMEDMLEVAVKELKEETGIENCKMISDRAAALDIITVKNHIRRGEFVSAHLHLNFAYIIEVSEEEELRIKEDENKDVGWIPLDRIEEYVSEEHMLPIYKKIIGRL